MTEPEAIAALAALAHRDRLAAFRALVAAAPEGLASGALAARLGIPPTRMSFHLAALARAGLVAASRQGRQVRYGLVDSRMRALLAFLMADCCAGRPELCGVALAPGAPWAAGRCTAPADDGDAQ
ncbi:MAG: hypothetical protein KatS3mg118_0942 [Paracoccaceae bacterium]|nr:MAG: transcriptional regulator [Alphaproteobacteria bacterium]GIX12983.1 MAG: hypothetical protein KatS3mg118_0942 [Paracoccaceae bacterium]